MVSHPVDGGRSDDETTDLFLSLTPERVLEAVERGGLAPSPVCYPLNSFENRVYEVELEDRSRVIAKFYRPGRWSREQILEEHSFLAELAAAELPVCTVMPFPDGETLKQIDEVYYCLAERRGGRAPDELSDADAERLGMFIARMHNVGAERPAERPRLDAERYVRRTVRWLREHQVLPKALEGRYFAAAEAIAEIADARAEGVAIHRIHADLHLGNVLHRDERLWVLDFDDMVNGPAVQDLWLALPGRDPETVRQRAILLAGYERFRLFDRRTLNLIEPLRGLRLVRYAGWIARRFHDPAFAVGWPHFGTDEYWQRETADLEEQLEVIRTEEPSPLAEESLDAASWHPGETKEGLTNKDYFWDWEGE